jgi:hypothetical protein
MSNLDTKDQMRVLRTAAKAIKEHDRIKAKLRQQESYLSLVCQDYSNTYKLWGVRPEHLRQACVARGLIT